MTTFLGTKTDQTMAPLVDAIANFKDVTVTSYDIGKNGSPFVIFKAPAIVASVLSASLVAMQLKVTDRSPHYSWTVDSYNDNGELCWVFASPCLETLSWPRQSIFQFFLWKKLKADFKKLANMVNEVNCNRNVIYPIRQKLNTNLDDVAKTQARKGFLSRLSSKFAAIAAVLLLSACASNGVELQQDGTGSDEMKPSPCACDPIPYQFKTFEWTHRDVG